MAKKRGYVELTCDELIADSIRYDRITRTDWTQELQDGLTIKCTGREPGGGYWGTTKTGEQWRVRLDPLTYWECTSKDPLEAPEET